MGIHPYGLFGTNESNNPFGADYELKRQLAARQAQLSELSNKSQLTPNDEKRKEQLQNAVNQLTNRLYKDSSTASDSPKNERSTNAPTNETPQKNVAKIYAEGTVTPKATSAGVYGKNQSSPNTLNNDYLKGFFLDLKI